MQINIFAKNISVDEPLEVFIKEKIGGLDKVIGNDKSTARVEIGKPSRHHRSGRIYRAEVNLGMGGVLLRASCEHEDLRNAIVDVKDELQEQIRKFKEKKADLAKKPQK